MDDKSARLLSIVDYFAGDNTRLFATGILNTGDDESAFGLDPFPVAPDGPPPSPASTVWTDSSGDLRLFLWVGI